MSTGSIDRWQKELDRFGTVVIRSSRQTPILLLLCCFAVAMLGIGLAVGGSPLEMFVGWVAIIGAVACSPRPAVTAFTGRPRLVVTTERVRYGKRSVPWSAVTEVVRHSMTVRGNTMTFVWLISCRDRLRLPETLDANLTELEAWLGMVRSQRDRVV